MGYADYLIASIINPLTISNLVTSQHFQEYDSTENTMLEKAKDVRRLE
jgi:hypothetical protein